MQRPASYMVAKTLLKSDAISVFEQAKITLGNQTALHFNECLDDVAGNVFPEKAARVQELNGYLKDFLVHKDELLDILKFGVPSSWCREFTVQGFDPVDQGLR
eukprot:10977936-Ditylum_brightwellii.AAC.1